jgi:hypothetical protein
VVAVAHQLQEMVLLEARVVVVPVTLVAQELVELAPQPKDSKVEHQALTSMLPVVVALDLMAVVVAQV